MILHTDNGKEFVSKLIVQMLKKMSPSTTTVTGRPRRLQDQGSIENLNKLAKRILSNLDQEDRHSGKIPNWTFNLGKLAAVVNSQMQKGSNQVTSYEAVFGMPYSGRETTSCNPQELRKCETVEQRMALIEDPQFASIAQKHCILDKEEEEQESDSDNEENFWEDVSSDIDENELSRLDDLLPEDDDNGIQKEQHAKESPKEIETESSKEGPSTPKPATQSTTKHTREVFLHRFDLSTAWKLTRRKSRKKRALLDGT